MIGGTATHLKARARHLRRHRRRGPAVFADDGFTLLELLVVLGILTLIATVAAPQVRGYLGQARSQAAQVQIKNISTALELFYLHNGGYPSEQTGLTALVAATTGKAAPARIAT
jgi:general secretion pathway protein G